MIKVTFIQEDGIERVVEDALPGDSLMELARDAGVEGIRADCGGSCACATCHVYVDPQWQSLVGAPDEVETGMLEMVSEVARDSSRLSCQIRLRPELDGLRVTVAPPII